MNLSNVDLNLLLVLHTVLAEGSVTRAAARLHVTPSAISNALARLRGLLNDRLVVRSGARLVATPRAEQLRLPIAAGLEQLHSAIVGEQGGPSRTRRRFTVACTDFVASVLVPPLTSLFVRRLPHATLRVVSVEYAVGGNGLATGDVDLLVGIPPVLPPGCFSEPAFRDNMVCITRRDHPMVGKRLTTEVFSRLGHIEIALYGVSTGVDEALARVGRARMIALTTAHFVVAPMVVLQTDLVATLPRRLANSFVASYPLRILAPPVKLPGLSFSQLWHVRCAEDPCTILLRCLVREALGRRMRAHRQL